MTFAASFCEGLSHSCETFLQEQKYKKIHRVEWPPCVYLYLNTRCVCSPPCSNPLVFVERRKIQGTPTYRTPWEKFTGRRLVRTSTTSRQRHYRGGRRLLTKNFSIIMLSRLMIDYWMASKGRYIIIYRYIHVYMYVYILYIYSHIHANYYPYTQPNPPLCYSSSKKKSWSFGGVSMILVLFLQGIQPADASKVGMVNLLHKCNLKTLEVAVL